MGNAKNGKEENRYEQKRINTQKRGFQIWVSESPDIRKKQNIATTTIDKQKRRKSGRNDRSPKSVQSKASPFQEKCIMTTQNRGILPYLTLDKGKDYCRHPGIRRSLQHEDVLGDKSKNEWFKVV